MGMLHVRMLGQFDVRLEGEPIVIPSRAAQSLLAYLLLNPGIAHRREQLAGLLWPDSSDENARHNLRNELWRIRKLIGSAFIDADEIAVTFKTDSGCWLDATILKNGQGENVATQELMDALEVYQGDLLPGFYDEWVLLERERLDALFEFEMQRLSDRLVSEEQWSRILHWSERWIAMGQSPEPAYRALMIAHSAMGDVAKVASTFERCARALRDDLDVEPSPQTRALFEQLSKEQPLPQRSLVWKDAPLPTPTVTFLFTGIEGSLKLWERFPDAMPRALKRHEHIIRDAVARHNGHAHKMVGDAFQSAFGTAVDALGAALDAQRALHTEKWGALGVIRVRMALYTGAIEASGDTHVGPVLNRAARLVSAANGGQILIPDVTAGLLRDHLPANIAVRDLGEHRLNDLARPEHIFQIVAPDLPSEFSPLKTLETLPNNLPLQLTSFIGREREIEQVKRLLATTRLLTITGAGGCGKTRLAAQAAADLVEDFADGVWFVELAPLADPALIAPRIASALGIFQQESRAIQSVVTDYLRDKSCLLVFDNCEHLIQGCAKLADSLLHECPQIKILASSREAFGIAGETAFRVPSLTLPDIKNLPPPESLAHYEAVRLFLDRALAVQPTFRVTGQNAAALAQICSRLDGIPLAIELAAVRVKVLSVEQIVERLDDCFRLLTGGSRTALPRQQTLRAAIDWSYALLSETEGALLRRLSVFASGWTLEAAEAVCGEDEGRKTDDPSLPGVRPSPSILRQEDVLDTLSHIVDKSLVIAEEQDGAARYRMLETIRQYAREKLQESGETEQLRDRHLDFYLKFSEETEPKLIGAGQLTWLERVETELDNVRLAIEWSLSEKRVEKGLRIAGALHNFWYTRGYWSETYQRILEALNIPGAGKRTMARGKALRTAGHLANYLGRLDDSRAFFEESIAILREVGDEGRPWLEHALSSHAYVLMLRDVAAARVLAEEGARLSRASGNRLALAVALNILGSASQAMGDFDSARTFFEETATITQELTDNRTYSAILGNLGYMYREQGDLSRAKEYLAKSLAISREIGNKRILGWAVEQLAEIARRLRQYDEAESLFQQALGELQQLGDKRFTAIALLHLGRLQLDKGNYSQAEGHLNESLSLFREGYQVIFVPWSLESFAYLATSLKKPPRAARLYGAAEALREKLGTPLLPFERTEYEPYLAAARAQLDEASFDAAWNQGRAMTLEQAIEYALREEKVA